MEIRRLANYMGGLLCALPLLSACDNDDWKDEVNALKEPVPQGIVWMMDDVTTVNGAEFEIRFRVNPSEAVLTSEDFQLDVADETVYHLQTDEAAAQTKASYVTTPAHYQLLSVAPDVNADGETLDGQWVATISVQADADMWLETKLALVANYTDVAGRTQQVSSDVLGVEMLPRATDGLNIWHPLAQTYRGHSTGNVLDNYVFLDMQTFVAEDGREKQYTAETCLAGAPKMVMDDATTQRFQIENKIADNSYVKLSPVGTDWTDFEADEDATYGFRATLNLTDITGTIYEVPVEYTIYRRNELVVSLPVNTTDREYSFDLTDELASLGYSSENFNALRRKTFSPQIYHGSDVPVAAITLSDDMQLNFSIYRTMESGTTTVADNFRITPLLSVFVVSSDSLSSFVVQDALLKVQLVVE